MHQIEVNELNEEKRESFVNFLSSIKECNDENSPLYSSYLNHIYRELKIMFSEDSIEDIAKICDADISLLQFLKFGTKYDQKQRLKPILQLVLDNPSKSSDILISEFVKSPDGLLFSQQFLNQKSLSPKQVEDFFGGMIGYKVISKIAASYEFEKLGSLIGFVLSGNFNQALSMANSEGIVDEELQAQYIYKEYLKSDKLLKCGQNGIPYDQNTAELLSLSPEKTNGVRTGNFVDHCFVNKETKTLHIGNTTLGPINNQGDSFIKFYLATNRMVQSEYREDGTPNPYYQYSISPFYILKSLFSSEKIEMSGHYIGRRAHEKAFVQEIEDGLAALSKDEINALGQLQFIGALGNISDPASVLIAFSHNPQLFGIDTLDFYHLSTRVQEAINKRPPDEDLYIEAQADIARTILPKIAQIIETLEKSKLSPQISKTIFENTLENLDSSLRLSFNQFNQALTRYPEILDEYSKIYDAFYLLNQKYHQEQILANTSSSRLWDCLLKTMKEFKDPHFYFEPNPEFSKPLKESALFKINNEIQNPERAFIPQNEPMIIGFNKLHSTLIECIEMAFPEIESPKRKKDNYWGAEAIEGIADLLHKTFIIRDKNGKYSFHIPKDYTDFSLFDKFSHTKGNKKYIDSYSLSPEFKRLKRDLKAKGYVLLSEFVEKLSFLYQHNFIFNSHDIPSTQKNARELIEFMKENHLLSGEKILHKNLYLLKKTGQICY